MLTQYDVDNERETKRQMALKDMVTGFANMAKEGQTKRAQALALSQDMKEKGYDVNPEAAAKNLEPEQSGFGKWFAKTPIGQSMGMEVQERPDLYGKRTAEYEAKTLADSRKRTLDEQLTRSQINKNNRYVPKGANPENLPWEQTAEGKSFIGKEQYKKNNTVNGKDIKEFDDRYNNILGEAEQLRSLIDKKGTFEAFGPHNQELAQKIDSMAIDAAKLFDPESVARESEVAAFRKMLFEPGSLTTSNNTATGTVDSFKKLIQDRATRGRGGVVEGDIANQMNREKNPGARITDTLPSGKKLPPTIAGIPTEKIQSNMSAEQAAQLLDQLKAKKAAMGQSSASRTGLAR